MNVKHAGPLAALATLVVALVGCSLTESNAKREPILKQVGGTGGTLVMPRRCVLDVVVLTRPQGDPILNETVWNGTDEQVVEPDLRRAWQANGLRIGRITGDLPPELESLVRSGPPNLPDMHTIVNPSGESTLVDPTRTEALPALNLLLSHPDGKIKGKVYQNAKPFLRVTPSHDATDGVAVRVVPELHHGQGGQGYGVMPSAGGVSAPQEFRITNGQQEETFRELAATVDLKDGQFLVVGTRPERRGSLGDALMQKPEGQSDRVLQTLILIWARRADNRTPADQVPEPPPALQPIDPKELAAATPESAAPGSKPHPAAPPPTP